MKKFIYYALPFVITILVIFGLEKQNLKIDREEIQKTVQNNNDMFDKWQKTAMLSLDDSQYDNLKVKKDNFTYNLRELPANKQNIFKLFILGKIKKDCKTMQEGYLLEKQNEIVRKIENQCDVQISQIKQKLYNSKGDKTHLFDKKFLEQLDVYLFN